MMWSTDDKRLIGVVNQAGSPKVTLLDEDHPDAALYQSLAQAFPGQMVQFSSSTEDGNRILVSVYSDTNPGSCTCSTARPARPVSCCRAETGLIPSAWPASPRSPSRHGTASCCMVT